MRRTMLALILATAIGRSASAASVDGIELYSATAGSGPTIIFVHGWTCDTSSWRDQVPAFDDDYRVITLDLPGHGGSGAPPADGFSMDLFARAVDAVRAEAGAEEIVVVGHSMGVVVARQYAIKYPDRIAGLVAVDGPLDLRAFPAQPFQAEQAPGELRARRENMIRGMFVADTAPELQEHILTMMLAAPDATATGAGAAMFDPAIRTADVIRAPALAVFAGTAELPDAATVKEIVPSLETVQVPGTGHFLMMEKPDEFNRLLRGFLERIDY